MPFSTYLRKDSAHDGSSSSSSSSSVDYASSPPKLLLPSASCSAPIPSSSLFQMPSFLLGPTFDSAAVPSMFDSIPHHAPPSFPPYALFPHSPAKAWLPTKYYTLDALPSSAPALSTSAASASASSPLSPPASAPISAVAVHAPSPFGYLNPDSPHHALLSSPSAAIPVYSQSGFDMLSILGRVASRPSPNITLGPVDLTCAFVVTDVRQTDSPIVYASPTFCVLTGYSESDVLGRNCRFLQAPGGRVFQSEPRRFTSPDAVRSLRDALDRNKEVQVSLINYRKDGCPFVNRISIVPVPASEGDDIAFHVGFQVDMNEQPALIAKRIEEGKFYPNAAAAGGHDPLAGLPPIERSIKGMGKSLRALVADASFQASVRLSTACNASLVSPLASKPSPAAPRKPVDTRDSRQWLHLLLLEHSPDFVHVLSLKGHFLYVSPGIRRILGYDPADLLGKSVGDFCHPSDAIPLLRELKESSVGPGYGGAAVPINDDADEPSTPHPATPIVAVAAGAGARAAERLGTNLARKTVNLLFRMRTKRGGYMWIESLGRMHVEAGKGRKAIVLSGRPCAVPSLLWGAVGRAGGLDRVHTASSMSPPDVSGDEDTGDAAGDDREPEREFWAMLCENGLFLVAGAGVRDVLGWGTGEMIGRSVRDFVLDDCDWDEGHAGGGSRKAAQVLGALRRASMAGTADNPGGNPSADDTNPGTMTTTTTAPPLAPTIRAPQMITCRMKKRDGSVFWMQLILYASEGGGEDAEKEGKGKGSGRVITQFRLLPLSPHSNEGSPAEVYAGVGAGYAAVHRGSGSGSGQGLYAVTQASTLSLDGMYSQHGGQNQNQNGALVFPPHVSPSHAHASAPAHASPPSHAPPPHTNVFRELESARGTSWQYELQQLKFVNDKLREEVRVLEARRREARRGERGQGQGVGQQGQQGQGRHQQEGPGQVIGQKRGRGREEWGQVGDVQA